MTDKQKIEKTLLLEIYKRDKEKFGKACAEQFGHLLPKNIDPIKWFDERLTCYDEQPYVIDPALAEINCNALYKSGPDGHGQIAFVDIKYINNKYTDEFGHNAEFARAHENIHKATNFKIDGEDEAQRVGVLVTQNFEQRGRALNEGITNIMAERITNHNATSYMLETQIARQLMDIVGEDALFAGMLIDPKILGDKYDSIAGKGSYVKLLDDTDNMLRLKKEARTTKDEKERAQIQSEAKALFAQTKNNLAFIKSNLSSIMPNLSTLKFGLPKKRSTSTLLQNAESLLGKTKNEKHPE